MHVKCLGKGINKYQLIVLMLPKSNDLETVSFSFILD